MKAPGKEAQKEGEETEGGGDSRERGGVDGATTGKSGIIEMP